MEEYKPMKWYESEFIWFLISLAWQLVWILLITIFVLNDFFYWVLLVGTAYTAYFIIKGIIYAWIINPMPWYKKQFNKIKNFFTKK